MYCPQLRKGVNVPIERWLRTSVSLPKGVLTGVVVFSLREGVDRSWRLTLIADGDQKNGQLERKPNSHGVSHSQDRCLGLAL